MDINELLNQIIFKYHLDQHYPHYRNMYEAQNILKDIIKNIVHDHKKAAFVGDDKTGIAFISNIAKDYPGIKFIYYDRNDKTSYLKEIARGGV